MITLKDLSEEQQAAIRQWAADGAGLDEIHTRIRDEFELRLTFMDARFLVADLEIEFEEDEPEPEPEPEPTPEPEPEPAAVPPAEEAVPEHTIPAEEVEDLLNEAGAGEAPPMPNVSVVISDIAAPGTVASGTVDFGNGETGVWTIDEMGRLGLNPTNAEFQPSEIEVMAFQTELQRVVQSRGY